VSRQIDGTLLWRVGLNTLGRLACETGDPRDGHDHEECVVDDEAYAADAVLGLLAAAAVRDEGKALDRLADLIETVRPT
jgi:hypothetical protein